MSSTASPGASGFWPVVPAFYPGWSYLMGQDRQRIKPLNRRPLAVVVKALRIL